MFLSYGLQHKKIRKSFTALKWFWGIESSNLSLYLLYYAKACKQLTEPISASLPRATQFLSKKCRNGGESLAALCLI